MSDDRIAWFLNITKAQAHQVITPSILVCGYQAWVPGDYSARLVAHAVDFRGEMVRQWTAGGVHLDEDWDWQNLEANFVMPEGADRIVFGVEIHPRAFARGIVQFNFYSRTHVHKLVEGHLLDPSLMEGMYVSHSSVDPLVGALSEV